MDRTWCLMAVGNLRGPNSTGAGGGGTKGLRGEEFGISMVKGRGGEAINIGVQWLLLLYFYQLFCAVQDLASWQILLVVDQSSSYFDLMDLSIHYQKTYLCKEPCTEEQGGYEQFQCVDGIFRCNASICTEGNLCALGARRDYDTEKHKLTMYGWSRKKA